MAKVEVRTGLVRMPILRNEAYRSSVWIPTTVMLQICAATNPGNIPFPFSPD